MTSAASSSYFIPDQFVGWAGDDTGVSDGQVNSIIGFDNNWAGAEGNRQATPLRAGVLHSLFVSIDVNNIFACRWLNE